VGERSPEDCTAFLLDLASRLHYRVQLTTDGYGAYLAAVEKAFGSQIDYAMLVKLYGPTRTRIASSARGRSLGGTAIIQGDPDPARASTSYVERQNLTCGWGCAGSRA